MILIRLKFSGNRFTTTCCSKNVKLDVLSDNTVPPDDSDALEIEDVNYSTPRGDVSSNDSSN